MISTPAIAATLPPKIRKGIGIQALSKSMPIARIARENQTSRKFVYEQKAIAEPQYRTKNLLEIMELACSPCTESVSAN